MAFTVSSATDISDIINQISTFSATNAGFTNHGSGLLSKGGIYWKLTNPAIALWGGFYHLSIHMSYSSTLFDEDHGAFGPTMASFYTYAGPYSNVFLFTDGVSVNCVVELTTNVYTHLSFGSITKTDTFTGGEFTAGVFADNKQWNGVINAFQYDAFWNTNFMPGEDTTAIPTLSYPGSYVRSIKPAGADNNHLDFIGFKRRVAEQSAFGCVGKLNADGNDSPIQELIDRSPNDSTLRTPLFPTYIFLRDPLTAMKKMSGYVANCRLVNMTYLDPEDVILTDWQVFPIVSKVTNLEYYPNSGVWGLAYKRV